MRRILFFVLLTGGVALLSACEVPTEFLVNSTVDSVDAVPGDGVCETNVEDQCTLRAAVMEANALDSPVTVHLTASTTYALQGGSFATDDDASAVGDLDINGSLTIEGNDAVVETFSSIRILDNHGTLTVNDLTLRGSGGTAQGALRNQGQAVLVDVAVNLMLTDSAAIHQVSGGLVVGRTTISEIQEGLRMQGGEALIVDSSIHTAGCILVCPPNEEVIHQTGGELTVVNSTVSQNRRVGWWVCGFPNLCPLPIEGNGLVQTGGSATLVRTTVARNLTGIIGDDVTLHGSVVANNTVADCSTSVTSLGHNHDEDGTCLSASATGDQTSDPAGLAPTPMQNHYPPQAGSALLDQVPVGTPYLCDDQHPVDQRGLPRPAGPACDIGAIERQPTDP